MLVETRIEDYKIRFAGEEDLDLILRFIRELADYEKLLHEVVATKEILRESLFVRQDAEVVIAEYRGEAVGFALFFHNFSTFLGKAGLYLEDLYIRPEMRGRGFGKTLLAFLANLAKERDCGRFEWWCIDWNEPSIKFYKSLGAEAMDEWTVYRVAGEALDNLSDEFKK